MKKKILITGATGFIGQSLLKKLSKLGRPVRGTIRSINSFTSNFDTEYVSVGDITAKTNWKESLVDIDCVIHCAGRSHIMNETQKDELKFYRSVNVEGTKQLAEQAAESKVKRLIFLSSIKVNGEGTNYNHADTISNNQKENIFMNNDIPNPKGYYAISKLEAEKILWEISSRTGLELTIIRLPLVYGSGVKGNMAQLLKLVQSRIPLPLKMVKNQRSMIGIDNLVDLLIRCAEHPNAAGKTFLASDGKDLSTLDLVDSIAFAMGHRARFFSVPMFLLEFLGNVLGKQKKIDRLIGSLKIDITHTRDVLNWKPPISVTEGIKRMILDK
jgi:nucleoside-diphosphate-sugar epimerase